MNDHSNHGQWYIKRDGQEPLGPISTELLLKGLEAGRVPADAWVSDSSGPPWRSIKDVLSVTQNTTPEPGEHNPEETQHFRTGSKPPEGKNGTPRGGDLRLFVVPLVLVGVVGVVVIGLFLGKANQNHSGTLVISSSVAASTASVSASASASTLVAVGSPESSSTSGEPEEKSDTSEGAEVVDGKDKIKIELVHAQLFHPFAPQWYLRSIRDDGFDDLRRWDSQGLGFAVVVEATNVSHDLLQAPSLEADLRLTGDKFSQRCKLDPRQVEYRGHNFVSFFASNKPGPKWRVDTRSETEGTWRPGERIRFSSRLDRCEFSMLTYDMGVTSITATLAVAAVLQFNPTAYLRSERTVVRLPASSLTLRKTTLPTGEDAYLSGNIVVRKGTDGGVVFDDLAKLGLSAEKVQSTEIPETLQPVDVTWGEIAGTITEGSMTHFADDPTLERGQRRYALKWGFTVKNEDIEKRLREKIESGDEAKKEKELEKLPKAVAEERSKLVKQLPCGSMQLVTNKTTRTAIRDDASKVCNSLETENSVIYSVNYILDRYEIPVALTYSKDNKKVLVPIANKAHSKFDPR